MSERLIDGWEERFRKALEAKGKSARNTHLNLLLADMEKQSPSLPSAEEKTEAVQLRIRIKQALEGQRE